MGSGIGAGRGNSAADAQPLRKGPRGGGARSSGGEKRGSGLEQGSDHPCRVCGAGYDSAASAGVCVAKHRAEMRRGSGATATGKTNAAGIRPADPPTNPVAAAPEPTEEAPEIPATDVPQMGHVVMPDGPRAMPEDSSDDVAGPSGDVESCEDESLYAEQGIHPLDQATAGKALIIVRRSLNRSNRALYARWMGWQAGYLFGRMSAISPPGNTVAQQEPSHPQTLTRIGTSPNPAPNRDTP